MLSGCSRTIQLNVLNKYDVEYLSECELYDYTETELASCYIDLSEEVRLGNKQLEFIERSSKNRVLKVP